MNVVVKTQKGDLKTLIVGGEVFLALQSIANFKGIDVQDVEADILAKSDHDPSHISECEHLKILLEQAKGELAAVLNEIESKRTQKATIKRNLKTVTDEGQKVQFQSQLMHVEKALEECVRESKTIELRVDNLIASIESSDVFDGSIICEELAAVLV